MGIVPKILFLQNWLATSIITDRGSKRINFQLKHVVSHLRLKPLPEITKMELPEITKMAEIALLLRIETQNKNQTSLSLGQSLT